MNSDKVKAGVEHAPHRSLLKADGYNDEQMRRPFVGVVNSFNENNGRTVMETLIADLNSRGHSKLTLKENGDICIQQGEELVPQEHLSNFPAKVYWPRLVEVFESNGLAAETTAQGIQVSW